MHNVRVCNLICSDHCVHAASDHPTVAVLYLLLQQGSRTLLRCLMNGQACPRMASPRGRALHFFSSPGDREKGERETQRHSGEREGVLLGEDGEAMGLLTYGAPNPSAVV